MVRRHALVLVAALATWVPFSAAAPHNGGTDALGDPLPAGARQRLGTIRLRHGEYVGSVAFSPDGSLLATKDGYCVAYLWDVKTGKEIRQLRGECAGFAGSPLIFSPDGSLLAFGDGKALHIWEAATGKVKHQHPGKGWLTSLAFSPDGKRLALASYDKSLTLFDWGAGKDTVKFAGHKERATALAFTPDGLALASAHGDGMARLWETATGKEVVQYRGHTGWVSALALAPNGKTLATGGSDKTLRLWDVAGGKQLHRLDGFNNAVSAVAFTPDGKHLAAATGKPNHLVGLWDVASGKRVRQIGPAPDGRQRSSFGSCLAFSPDGKLLATRGHDNRVVVLWDVAADREVHAFDAHASAVDILAVAADGKTLASASHTDDALYLWDLPAGTIRRKVPSHPAGVAALAVAPDGKTVASAAILDQSVYLWDAATGKRLLHIPPPDLPADRLFSYPYRKDVAVAFAPDGKALATGNSDGKVHLWELPSGKPLLTFMGQPAWIDRDAVSYPRPVSRLAFSADGQTLAVGSLADDVVYLYTAASGKLLRSCKPRPPAKPENAQYSFWDFTLVFSPDGKSLAAGGGRLDQSIRLWETATGQERRQFGGPQRALHLVAFSPDGRTLASWRRDSVIRLLDVASGQDVGALQGHRGEVLSVAFLPDGRLVSGSADTTILVWDHPPGKKPAAPPALSPKEVDALGTALAGPDAPKAAQAIYTLAAVPAASVPYLKDRLAPIPAPDAKTVARLIADLDSDQFAVRQKSMDDLENLGDLVGPALQRALTGKPSLDVQKNVPALLDRLNSQVLTGEKLRAWRAVEVLELAATPQARVVLARLAEGTDGARLTRDARRALRRLGHGLPGSE